MSKPSVTIHGATKLRIGNERITPNGTRFRDIFVYTEDETFALELVLFGEKSIKIEMPEGE